MKHRRLWTTHLCGHEEVLLLEGGRHGPVLGQVEEHGLGPCQRLELLQAGRHGGTEEQRLARGGHGAQDARQVPAGQEKEKQGDGEALKANENDYTC